MKKVSFAQQDSITRQIEERFREIAPYDTGNLAENAIKREYLGDGKWRIIVDESVAPYMKYTNESWDNFAPPLQGKKNPNEGWWHVACQEAMRTVANRLKGTIRQ